MLAVLQAVCGVHEQRIVHSDLKPANFLLVEGALKLIDFGIAKAISGDTTSIARESQASRLIAEADPRQRPCNVLLRLVKLPCSSTAPCMQSLPCCYDDMCCMSLGVSTVLPGGHAQLHVPRGHPGRQQQHSGRARHEGGPPQ